MTRYPGATWRPLPASSYTPGGRTAHLGLILHVQQGNGSPWGWFANPASKDSSTFWVSKSGGVEQYMEAGSDKSWAQMAGNPLYDSVETEGYDSEPLTGAQVAALSALCAWEHATFGMPLVAISTPGLAGFGWHGMGGVAWGNHPGCPGDLRRAQMPAILAAVTTVSQTIAAPGSTLPTTLPTALTAAAPALAQEDDMATVIFNGTYGYGLLDGGRLIGIGDQSTVDAFQGAGFRRVAVSDADFLRLRSSSPVGLLLYCPPDQGGRGWAWLRGDRAVGLGDQATVDELKGKGADTLIVSAADFDRLAAA